MGANSFTGTFQTSRMSEASQASQASQMSDNSQQSVIGFPPHPTPAMATTNLSKDMAFSTNSSSSTLYQDSQQQQQQQPQQPQLLPPFPQVDQFLQFPQHPHFISSSAPVNTSVDFSDSRRQQLPQQLPPLQTQKLLQQPPPPSQEHFNVAEHPVQDLLLMLSALLQKIVEANDLLHTEHYDEALQDTRQRNENSMEQNRFKANVLSFHGRNIPAISLYAYLTRILKYCPVTNDVFLSLLVYFDRIAKRANNGEFSGFAGKSGGLSSESSYESRDPDRGQVFVIDSYNIHRLIISGITVASKFFSDVFYKNSRYAKVGGLPLEELNHLEIQFLMLLDFKLMIQVEEMNRYGDLLLKFWKREQAKQAKQAQ
ncbi:hypothetical protein FOA43_002384 [Brettanomyces nanus]|uniref:Cyclin n=1 Tax=Eeniella nana TaxID=13502 RepID=A0A875S792_EENNA|nr:uncharacterized protein FOA43_002384 [Brettanomyces nanus]QPG75044.1 hypothetical protein FOA43_002384 [Brettanomyces nanus]